MPLPGAIPYGSEARRLLVPFHPLKVLSRLFTVERPVPVIPWFIGVLACFQVVYTGFSPPAGVIPVRFGHTMGPGPG